MGRSSRKQAEVTREMILDAAETLFSRKGVAAVPLTSIARHAGLTTGAVYWHFRDKDTLLAALFERLHMPLSESIRELLTGPMTGPGIERIEAFCLRFMGGYLDSPAKIRTARILFTQVELSEESVLTKRIRAATRELCDALASTIALIACIDEKNGGMGNEAGARLLAAILVGRIKLALILGKHRNAVSTAKSDVMTIVIALFHSSLSGDGISRPQMNTSAAAPYLVRDTGSTGDKASWSSV